jgi:hypothetical protein
MELLPVAELSFFQVNTSEATGCACAKAAKEIIAAVSVILIFFI